MATEGDVPTTEIGRAVTSSAVIVVVVPAAAAATAFICAVSAEVRGCIIPMAVTFVGGAIMVTGTALNCPPLAIDMMDWTDCGGVPCCA